MGWAHPKFSKDSTQRAIKTGNLARPSLTHHGFIT